MSFTESLDLAKAVGAILGPLVAMIGIGFVIRQLKINRQSLQSQARGAIYQLSFNVYKLFIDNPDLRAYFYENAAIPKSKMKKRQVMAAASLLLDFFEHIAHSENIIDPPVFKAWSSYAQATFAKSPVMRSFVNDNPSFYTPATRRMIGSASRAG